MGVRRRTWATQAVLRVTGGASVFVSVVALASGFPTGTGVAPGAGDGPGVGLGAGSVVTVLGVWADGIV